jgi:hypothetical protein
VPSALERDLKVTDASRMQAPIDQGAAPDQDA